ncbi:hypothetical protein NST62_11535 [Ureibacillus sp. FSL K6-8385]|nr:hypothetical protein [Ureibacillus terrenus]MED3662878.1 hypothetical protein [Ureibacillus terrenus]MED3763862.1 hypothetical protein [Ureibacillus terrenus]
MMLLYFSIVGVLFYKLFLQSPLPAKEETVAGTNQSTYEQSKAAV